MHGFSNRFSLLTLAAACVVIGSGRLSTSADAQAVNSTSSPAPAFDVATIKPHRGYPDHQAGLHRRADGIVVELTVMQLVAEAYNTARVSGYPSWAQGDWLDIEAKMSEADIAEMKKLSPDESRKRSNLMLQTLLAERFKLKVHTETKQVPIYELVVAKGGVKIRNASNDKTPLQTGRDGKSFSGLRENGTTTSVAQNYSMKSFADYLSIPAFGIGRPVVDKTGLTGTYNFTLNWSIYARSARPIPEGGASDPGGEGTFLTTALKEIGLDLHPAKGDIENLVIDHVERPSEN